MIDREDTRLSLSRQCELLAISRSSFYYTRKPVPPETFELMKQMDALFMQYPFYGSRKMTSHLKREGLHVSRHRVRRLMRIMGLQAIYRAPKTSTPHPEHKIYPYLLRNVSITTANHVWCQGRSKIRPKGNTPIIRGLDK